MIDAYNAGDEGHANVVIDERDGLTFVQLLTRLVEEDPEESPGSRYINIDMYAAPQGGRVACRVEVTEGAYRREGEPTGGRVVAQHRCSTISEAVAWANDAVLMRERQGWSTHRSDASQSAPPFSKDAIERVVAGREPWE